LIDVLNIVTKYMYGSACFVIKFTTIKER